MFEALDAVIARQQKEKARYESIFKELDIKCNYQDILDLLQDEPRLKAVVAKLKMKVYW